MILTQRLSLPLNKLKHFYPKERMLGMIQDAKEKLFRYSAIACKNQKILNFGQLAKVGYLKDGVGRASVQLNKITGYDHCEELRKKVEIKDQEYQRIKEMMQSARNKFAKSVSDRSQCQKELNNLLQRKSLWRPDELDKFTELYRQEISLEQFENESKKESEGLERQVDLAHSELMSAIRERYQVEQLWSDKIRKASTFGTFGLMFINVSLFLIIQIFIEPAKRKSQVTEFKSVLSETLKRLDLLDKELHKSANIESLNHTPIASASTPSLHLMMGIAGTLSLATSMTTLILFKLFSTE